MKPRDAIRKALLNDRTPKISNMRKRFDLGDGVEVELRCPTGEQFDRMRKALDNGMHAFNVACVMECLYEPGTDVKIFDECDAATFMEMPPTTAWLLDVAKNMQSMLEEAGSLGKLSKMMDGSEVGSP